MISIVRVTASKRWTSNSLLTKESFMWWHFSNNRTVNCISCRWSIECLFKKIYICICICAQRAMWYTFEFVFCDSSWPIPFCPHYIRFVSTRKLLLATQTREKIGSRTMVKILILALDTVISLLLAHSVLMLFFSNIFSSSKSMLESNVQKVSILSTVR